MKKRFTVSSIIILLILFIPISISAETEITLPYENKISVLSSYSDIPSPPLGYWRLNDSKSVNIITSYCGLYPNRGEPYFTQFLNGAKAQFGLNFNPKDYIVALSSNAGSTYNSNEVAINSAGRISFYNHKTSKWSDGSWNVAIHIFPKDKVTVSPSSYVDSVNKDMKHYKFTGTPNFYYVQVGYSGAPADISRSIVERFEPSLGLSIVQNVSLFLGEYYVPPEVPQNQIVYNLRHNLNFDTTGTAVPPSLENPNIPPVNPPTSSNTSSGGGGSGGGENDGDINCPNCNPSGGGGDINCPSCGGDGFIHVCPPCNGGGGDCPNCGGTGHVPNRPPTSSEDTNPSTSSGGGGGILPPVGGGGIDLKGSLEWLAEFIKKNIGSAFGVFVMAFSILWSVILAIQYIKYYIRKGS